MSDRLFTQAQRALLYLKAKGRCQDCGVFLDPSDWHADHVVPWSKGGKTKLRNGQALCPQCNLKKGSFMHSPTSYIPAGKTLRLWQSEFVTRFIRQVTDFQVNQPPNGKDAFILNAFPGSGKTFAQLFVMKYLLKEDIVDFVVVVVPSDALRTQFAEEAEKLGLSFYAKKNLKVSFKANDGIVLTYQQLGNAATVDTLDLWCQSHRVFVSADEMHHLAGDEDGNRGNDWGRNFFEAFGRSHVRLLTSGTPFRSDGNPLPWARYVDDSLDLSAPHAYTYGYGPSERWDQPLCALGGPDEPPSVREVVFHPWDGEVTWVHTDGDVEEEFTHRLSDNLDEIYDGQRHPTFIESMKSARRKACLECGTPKHPNGTQYVRDQIQAANKQLEEIRRVHPWAGGLIVCDDTTHADSVALVVEELTGHKPVVIHGNQESPKQMLKLFKNDRSEQRTPWVVAVQMVTEGIDIKHLRVCVYLTRKVAPLFWTQVLGRVLRLEPGIEEQSAHFFQYDDGIDLVKEGRGEDPVPQDVRVRKYAKRIKEELDVVIKNKKVGPPPPPYLCPICKDPTSAFYTGKCPGFGVSPCPRRKPPTTECVSATGENTVQIFDGVEYQVSELQRYQPIAVRWGVPVAKAKALIDKMPRDERGLLESYLNTITNEVIK
jgi:superfamily II DNA or RNA helicase